MPSEIPQPSTLKVSPHEQLLYAVFDASAELIFFDVGACRCESSLRYEALFPEAIIYAFEPLPLNVRLAHEVLQQRSQGRIKLQDICISDTRGSITFHVSAPGNETARRGVYASSSIYAPHLATRISPHLKFEETIEVNADTLSNWMDNHKINTVDLIHMDIQGAELAALKGLGEKIKAVKTFWLEVENISLYKDQPLRSDVEKYLIKAGFVKLIDTVNDISGDQFWINKNYIQDVKNPVYLQKLKNKNLFWFLLRDAYYSLKYRVKSALGKYKME